ncbi:MAG: hypothetical protein M0Z52_04060 [Actinomycetota bacterium]|nr:hypothetical protein [Actinomycetota bacterium]
MSFSEALKEMTSRVEGAVSAMIIGADGMPVEEYTPGERLLDLEDLGAEASRMIRDVNAAAEGLRIGNAREFALIADSCGIILRKITEEYYLALVLRPEGNYGKGRFVLKSVVPKIEGEF